MATRILKIAMMAESQCDARVAPIYKRYADVQTTILAGAGEIQLHLKTRAASLEAAQERVDRLAEEIEEELDDNVFSDNGDSLEQIVGYYVQMRNATLAVAESCTGGLLAERITSVSGSSRYFLGGAVVYSNQLKTAFVDVPAELIEKHGAVSREIASALAEGIASAAARRWESGLQAWQARRWHAGGRWGLALLALASEKAPKSRREIFPATASASAGSPANWRWT
jgi:nicotinamide-nucleotide amidase